MDACKDRKKERTDTPTIGRKEEKTDERIGPKDGRKGQIDGKDKRKD